MLDLFDILDTGTSIHVSNEQEPIFHFDLDHILSLESVGSGHDADIKSILDDELGHIQIDVKFLKRIRDYGQAFVNTNPDHVAFFGGCLLGVHPIRFRAHNLNEWFDDIMELNDVSIKSRILELPNIDPEWKRGTDVMNLSCVWLVHRIYHSNIPESVKYQGMIDTLMVLQYKLITSIMTHYFKYPANEEVAQATYAALSKKFSLKTAGSWNALLLQRSKDIVDHRSVHLNAIKHFRPDELVQYMITDIQGRLRNIVKNLWAVFNKVRLADERIIAAKMTGFNPEGEMVVMDMKRNFTPYKRYLQTIVADQSQFIKEDVFQVVCVAMPTMDPKNLRLTLEYISANYRKPGHADIEKLMTLTLLHAFNFISLEKSEFLRKTDLSWLITKLRAVYMSSRSSDKDLMEMRTLGEKIAVNATKTRNAAQASSIRTGVLLYLITRTFAMKHYG